jgi:hypothetical protein
MRIDGINVNPKVTEEAIAAAAERGMTELDNPGFCIACGAEAEGVEPDARKYKCESCGRNCVYGAEELLLRIAL